jgi:hypothetical protein
VFNFEHSTMGPFDIIPSLRSILAYKWNQVNRAGGKRHGGDKDYFGLRSERESIEKAIPSWEHLIGSGTEQFHPAKRNTGRGRSVAGPWPLATRCRNGGLSRRAGMFDQHSPSLRQRYRAPSPHSWPIEPGFGSRGYRIWYSRRRPNGCWHCKHAGTGATTELQRIEQTHAESIRFLEGSQRRLAELELIAPE